MRVAETKTSSSVKVKLTKKPKGATIIEGFPGYGLVATITTGFLLDHLNTERIGTYFFTEAPPTLAVHGCKIVDPVGIYYNKKYNLVIIHAITSPIGIEWKAADIVLDVARQLDAKKIITLEGVGSQDKTSNRVFHYATQVSDSKRFRGFDVECLDEGIIVGVTAALVQKVKRPLVALFAETHMNLPDSKAAAAVITTLDKYLRLDINPEPLLRQAEEFETKLKSLMHQATQAQKTRDRKQLSYVG